MHADIRRYADPSYVQTYIHVARAIWVHTCAETSTFQRTLYLPPEPWVRLVHEAIKLLV